METDTNTYVLYSSISAVGDVRRGDPTYLICVVCDDRVEPECPREVQIYANVDSRAVEADYEDLEVTKSANKSNCTAARQDVPSTR